MPWSSVVYLALTFIAFVTALLLAAYAWRHRDVPSAATFAGMMLTLVVILGSMAFSNLGTLETGPFWFRLRFSTMVLLPVFFIAFALQYSGLGLSIVRTLVTTELNGTIDIRPASSDDLAGAGLGDGYNRQHGTVIELCVPTDD